MSMDVNVFCVTCQDDGERESKTSSQPPSEKNKQQEEDWDWWGGQNRLHDIKDFPEQGQASYIGKRTCKKGGKRKWLFGRLA